MSLRPVHSETVCALACAGAAQDTRASMPGLTKEKFRNMFWSMLLISALSAKDSQGFSLKNSLSKLLQSHGDFFGRV